MRIVETKSIFGGIEFLMFSKYRQWMEIDEALRSCDSIQSLASSLITNNWEKEFTFLEDIVYFKKHRISVGLYSENFSNVDLYAQHLAAYREDRVDVGIDIIQIDEAHSDVRIDKKNFVRGMMPNVPIAFFEVAR